MFIIILYGEDEANRRKKHRADIRDGKIVNKRDRQFVFYKDSTELCKIDGKINAIEYCKSISIPYSVLVFKFKEWNGWKCISKIKTLEND